MSTRPDLLSHAGRCPEPLIAEAERRVGHTFPPSYRLVLGELGTVAFGAQEIYGLIHHDLDAVGVPNALWLYLSNVNEFAQPRRYFEFYNYGDGTTVALDLERCSASGECA